MKGYAFQNLCPARTAASTTASVRGTHLMADECCFANSAPCAGPLAGEHNLPSHIGIEIRFCIPRPRAIFDRAVCAMLGASSSASGGDSGAHWAQGRANGKLNLFFLPRAHTQIQTDVQTERRDRKSARAKHGVLAENVSCETILNSSFRILNCPNSLLTPHSFPRETREKTPPA